jgi:uncharacterized protein (DUF2252 family)
VKPTNQQPGGAELTVEHRPIAEGVDRGRSARTETPRRSHSTLDASADRDPIGWLAEEAATRVPELLPIRYARMQASPLAFFRGAARVMANDLATSPRAGLGVQLCGDAHICNFGGFASPERDLVFGLNDFDETLRGPFEWDVKRLAASVEIAGRDRGLSSPQRAAALLGSVSAYRKTMRKLAGDRELEAWYSTADADGLEAELVGRHEHREAKTLAQAAARARSNDSLRALSKLTRVVDDELRFVSDPPLIVPLAELGGETSDTEAELRAIFRRYRSSLQPDRRVLLEGFRYGDLARKVVGVGSVGTRCWVLLLLGRHAGDPLILQIKEAQASVLEPLLGPSGHRSHAERVVQGQRLCQPATDIFLGWTDAENYDGARRDFYVRQLRDWKVSLDVERISPRGLAIFARWCGAALARAHARSGDRIAIAAYLGKKDVFDRSVAAFAAGYAEINARDHASLCDAVRTGRLPS